VAAEGLKRGVRVYEYDQDRYTVRIWGSADAPGTWVIGPVAAVIRGIPVEQALSVPFVVRSYQLAQLQ
jgi:hypothetical protein